MLDNLKEKGIYEIIGGPPYQVFSMVGTRDINDERNSLYLEYVRFVSNHIDKNKLDNVRINEHYLILEDVIESYIK